MNADGFFRILSGDQGPVQTVTIRRLATPSNFEIQCRAAVLTVGMRSSGATVGDILQGFDQVMVTKREMDAASWPSPPRRGDQVIFEDGKTTVVQANPQPIAMSDDTVYVMRCLGGA